jgi:hypothetical protein
MRGQLRVVAVDQCAAAWQVLGQEFAQPHAPTVSLSSPRAICVSGTDHFADEVEKAFLIGALEISLQIFPRHCRTGFRHFQLPIVCTLAVECTFLE